MRRFVKFSCVTSTLSVFETMILFNKVKENKWNTDKCSRSINILLPNILTATMSELERSQF